MSFLPIILAAAAVWRITHMLQVEDGPCNAFKRLREQLRRLSLTGPVDCFYCLSLWVAAPFAFSLSRMLPQAAILAFSLSAFAIAINRFVSPALDAAVYFEASESKESLPCPAAAMHETQRS